MAAELPVNAYPYGASKAAINWTMRKLHHDFPDFGGCLFCSLTVSLCYLGIACSSFAVSFLSVAHAAH